MEKNPQRQPADNGGEEKVLVLAPTGSDARIMASVLGQAGHEIEVFPDLGGLCERIDRLAGLIIMAEEGLDASHLSLFRQKLAAQAPWSDIPIILLTLPGSTKEISLEAYHLFGEKGNINFLERPVRSITLVSAVRAALKARRRQYQLRDLIRQKEEYVKELQQTNEELSKINRELEEFAYVASHDLQEPLRTVSYYVDLLSMQSSESMDEDGKKFVEVVKDGALRAQLLIQDLLDFARIGTRGRPFSETDMEKVLRQALFNLRVAVQETGGVITHDPLPVIFADELQMIQLVQNLLSNSLKFRGENPPHVHVSVSAVHDHFRFSVADNGIGIDSKYKDRIFRLFQRLHDKATYPGTGIGLAVCKKIVERHGGEISFDSTPGQGTIFHFSINPRRAAQEESFPHEGSKTRFPAAPDRAALKA